MVLSFKSGDEFLKSGHSNETAPIIVFFDQFKNKMSNFSQNFQHTLCQFMFPQCKLMQVKVDYIFLSHLSRIVTLLMVLWLKQGSLILESQVSTGGTYDCQQKNSLIYCSLCYIIHSQ